MAGFEEEGLSVEVMTLSAGGGSDKDEIEIQVGDDSTGLANIEGKDSQLLRRRQLRKARQPSPHIF